MLDKSVEVLVKPDPAADEIERAIDGKGCRGQHYRTGRPKEFSGEVRTDLHWYCPQCPVGVLPKRSSLFARYTRRSGRGNQQIEPVMAISEG